MHLYYLGPEDTPSYLAAEKCLSKDNFNFIPKSNLYEVIKTVNSDARSVAIVPIEDSIEETINIMADALAQQHVFAHGEIHLDINFGLYATRDSKIENIKKVYSIAPAISQTGQYIHKRQLSYDYVDSTIQGLEKISSDIAAIVPVGSGKMYGHAAIESNIQDYPHNVARFLVMKNDNNFESETNNIMLLITPKYDKTGLLASILTTFALFDISLSWTESRPLKTQLGMYRFFVQTDIGLSDNLNKVISILETLDFLVKIIGAFHRQ